jgi:DNA-binding NtrC family response regulator
MKELEKKMITEAMEKTGGNKTKAADLLDISYKNLFDKIKEYGIMAVNLAGGHQKKR